MKPRYIIASVIAVALIAAVTLLSYDKDRGLVLRFSSDDKGGVTGASGKASGDGTVKKVSNGDVSSDETGTAESGETTGSGAATATPVQTADSMKVRIIVWNDTLSKKVPKLAIVVGGSTFVPDPAKKSNVGSVGPVKYGEKTKLKVYLNGVGEEQVPLEFDFTVLKGMKPDSEQDAIHVEVSDRVVRVLGNPIDNFSKTLGR